MYLITNFLPPELAFTNPYTPAVAAAHQAAADASGAAIPALQSSVGPTIAGIDPAATTIDAHATLNQLAGDGFAAAAADQTRLSVDDQLSPDGTITGHITGGQSLTAQQIGTPPVTVDPPWPPAPDPPIDIPVAS